MWIYNEIKKSGGYAIFPHPFWTIKEQYHTETKMSEAIFKKTNCVMRLKLWAAARPRKNNLQLSLYYDMRLKGMDMPIVGSSDSHSSLPGVQWFDETFTLLFEGNNGVFGAVDDGFSVAAERL
ncbi:MAG: hypothetical protein L6V93_08045 [Clostridiales bacterium]|nr:MAG: hypothetical protein L6V93_08045 [Clostridiales bacterium]